jgi:DNA-directed RNA polymerase specialized sigma24 family protein
VTTAEESAESLLQRCFEEHHPGTRESLLCELLFVRARPVIARVVGRRLERASPQDREDVTGEIVLALLNRFAEATGEEPHGIDRFFGYVSATANNACDQYYRKRFPERHRLKNRVYYLVTSSKSHALWEDAGGKTLCGRERDRGRAGVGIDPGAIAGQIAAGGKTPSQLLEAAFRQIGGPVDLDDLVQVFAILWGVKDQQVELDIDFENRSAVRPDSDAQIDRRRALEGLWREVGELSVPQRAALLWNLRDGQASSALVLLPMAGIATMRQIAAALETSAEELAALWDRLPLEDQEIAVRLGVTRQQVINLRLAARQRLVRRMEKKGIATRAY